MGPLLSAATFLAFTQSPSLAPARFVTERATEVSWNRDASFLAYGIAKEAGGLESVGIYDVSRRVTKLLSTEAHETIDSYQMLHGRPMLVVSKFSDEQVGKKTIRHRSVWTVDGLNLSSKQVWAGDVPEDYQVPAQIDASPSLAHAIVTIHSGKGDRHIVVLLGGSSAGNSVDLDDAKRQGHELAGWSIDGTAVFAQALAGVPILGDLPILSTFFRLSRPSTENTAVDVSNLLNNRISAYTWAFESKYSQPKIPVELGAPTLEMVPTNGVLRTIRFRGFWSEPGTVQPTALKSKTESLAFKRSTGSANSLWLTPNINEPSEAVLVSPQAEKFWLERQGRAVAFTVNGVLFVRQVKSNP